MSQLGDLFDEHKTNTQHRLTAESPDWNNRIVPALREWGITRDIISRKDSDLLLTHLCQTIYVMGYKRGMAQRTMPMFVVAEEGK